MGYSAAGHQGELHPSEAIMASTFPTLPALHRLTQPLQGAVAADLGLHGRLVGRRQLGQVVEGVGEGRVAAVVPHASSHDDAAANADSSGTFTAAGHQGGAGGELGGVVHSGSTL